MSPHLRAPKYLSKRHKLLSRATLVDIFYDAYAFDGIFAAESLRATGDSTVKYNSPLRVALRSGRRRSSMLCCQCPDILVHRSLLLDDRSKFFGLFWHRLWLTDGQQSLLHGPTHNKQRDHVRQIRYRRGHAYSIHRDTHHAPDPEWDDKQWHNLDIELYVH